MPAILYYEDRFEKEVLRQHSTVLQYLLQHLENIILQFYATVSIMHVIPLNRFSNAIWWLVLRKKIVGVDKNDNLKKLNLLN